MKFLAWKPPPELLDRVLGSDPGGGRPSIIQVILPSGTFKLCTRLIAGVGVEGEQERPNPCECGRPWLIQQPIQWYYDESHAEWVHPDAQVCTLLLLTLDGQKCSLSIARAVEMLLDKGITEIRYGTMVLLLVLKFGGEIVEVK